METLKQRKKTEREDLFTAGDIVQKLGVSRSTVFKWFDTGELKRVDVPALKQKRVRLVDLQQFLDKLGKQINHDAARVRNRKMPFA